MATITVTYAANTLANAGAVPTADQQADIEYAAAQWAGNLFRNHTHRKNHPP